MCPYSGLIINLPTAEKERQTDRFLNEKRFFGLRGLIFKNPPREEALE